MATNTVTSTKTGHPRPPDSVRVLVSATIEADFIAHSAFPKLRHGNHDEIRSGFALYWCGPGMAEDVLRYATGRRQQVAGPLRAAYGALISNCQREIEEAKSRPGWLAGSEPKPLPGCGQANRFLCTRSQLRLMGMPEGLRLPGDEGGPVKKASFTDFRRQQIGITRAEWNWPGTFMATMKPNEQEKKSQAEARAMADQENQRLRLIESLPKSANEFREDLSRRSLAMTGMIIGDMTAPLGYQFSEEVVEEFKLLARGMYKLLKEGAVTGHSSEQVKRQHLIGRAKQDTSFQSFLRLVHSSDGGE